MFDENNALKTPVFSLWVERVGPFRKPFIMVRTLIETGSDRTLSVPAAELLIEDLKKVVEEAKRKPLERGDVLNPRRDPEPPKGTVLRSTQANSLVMVRDYCTGLWQPCGNQNQYEWNYFSDKYKVLEVGKS